MEVARGLISDSAFYQLENSDLNERAFRVGSAFLLGSPWAWVTVDTQETSADEWTCVV